MASRGMRIIAMLSSNSVIDKEVCANQSSENCSEEKCEFLTIGRPDNSTSYSLEELSTTQPFEQYSYEKSDALTIGNPSNCSPSYLAQELGIEPSEDDLLPIPVVAVHNAPCHEEIDTLDNALTCELNSTNPSEFDIGRGVFMLPFDDVDLEKRCLYSTDGTSNRKKTENDLDNNFKTIADISKTVNISPLTTGINNIQDANVIQLLITGDEPENDLSDESWVPSDAPLHQTNSEPEEENSTSKNLNKSHNLELDKTGEEGSMTSQSTANGNDNLLEAIAEKKKTRKRIRKQGEWKKSLTAKLKNSGQSFKQFWAIGNIDKQREFIIRHIKSVFPKYAYKKVNPTKDRSENKSYHFQIENTVIRVCRLFFLNTLNIGDTMLRTALKKTNEEGFIDQDCRGKHGKQSKVDDETKEFIRAHIQSIPRVESHYLRAQTKREFIDGSLNIATLYRLYTEECEQNKKPIAKKSLYRQIFNTEYNITWYTPKKDQCALCENFKNSNDDRKKDLQQEYDTHIRNKQQSRVEKQSDVEKAKTDQSVVVAVYDLQAVFPTPCGEVSSFYYKSKLNAFNFTIYDIPSAQGYAYLWNESVAMRGSNEIATCVLKFLTEHCIGKKHVIFYSDNCCGQNKNRFVTSMYMYAVSKLNIETIKHKFLITGHSQNEGDSMHSCIEKERKRVLKSGPIYVPSQWAPVIKLAKKQKPQYCVTEMSTSDFLDFKKYCSDSCHNLTQNREKQKVIWNNIKVLKVEKSTPNILYYKTNYSDVDFQEVDSQRLQKRVQNSKPKINRVQKAYKTNPKISFEKKEALLFLCRTDAIKEVHHPYYQNLNAEASKKTKTTVPS